MALYVPSRRDGHRQGCDCPGAYFTRRRLRSAGAKRLRQVFLRQADDHTVLVPPDFLSGRVAGRLPLLPLYAHTSARPAGRLCVDTRAGPGSRCGGAATGHRKRRRQEGSGGRNPVAVAGGSQSIDPRHPGPGRSRRPGAGRAGARQSRHGGGPPGDDPVGAGAGDEARIHPHAGAPPRPDAEPDARAGGRRGRSGSP